MSLRFTRIGFVILMVIGFSSKVWCTNLDVHSDLDLGKEDSIINDSVDINSQSSDDLGIGKDRTTNKNLLRSVDNPKAKKWVKAPQRSFSQKSLLPDCNTSSSPSSPAPFKQNSRLASIFSSLKDSVKTGNPKIMNRFQDYYNSNERVFPFEDVPYIFVYGTLRSDVIENKRTSYWYRLNQNTDDFMAGDIEDERIPGIVLSANMYAGPSQGYPFMVLEEGQEKSDDNEENQVTPVGVHGELIKMNTKEAMEKMLEIADDIEGFRINGPKNYWRTIAKVTLEDGREVNAWVYIVKKYRVGNLPVVESGDWIDFSKSLYESSGNLNK